jgi:ribosomal peptide maturation radical SAM protein 1
MDTFACKCDLAFESLGAESDAVLIVPPFADIYRPALGVHLLQSCSERAGLRVKILYANLLFAALSGEHLYNSICYASRRWMWGDRLFAASAFGLPRLGHELDSLREQIRMEGRTRGKELTIGELYGLEERSTAFCSEIATRLMRMRVLVVGSTSTFEQTAASVALLTAVKRADPRIITVIGGANCEGELAEGVTSLGAQIDFVFSGECEEAFPEFLRRVARGEVLPRDRIVRCSSYLDMNALPEPSFDDYFTQLETALPSRRKDTHIWLPYESSRGCWWGAKRHCTFCGLNGETMTFRQKSPERVIDGLRRLLMRYPTKLVCMIDNIMPHAYFRILLPRLAESLPPAHIFYETKSNLSLDQVSLLKRAGVGLIQPGIEALSSSLLRRMDKGVTAPQNLALLRYARSVGLAVNWNLLYDFPGDERGDYDSTLALFPLIRHLNPPTGLYPISIDRFSPYFTRSSEYGIANLRPLDGYSWVFPTGADLRKLAYHFQGDYASAHRVDPDLLPKLNYGVETWQLAWNNPESPPPVLNIGPLNEDHYLLIDTRGLAGTSMLQFLTPVQARSALVGGPLAKDPFAKWAIQSKLAVELDGWSVPLAVTDVETWRRFQNAATAASGDSGELGLVIAQST